MRAGVAKGQEDDGRGWERGKMRLGRGMVKKGEGRGRHTISGVGKMVRCDERKERACLKC